MTPESALLGAIHDALSARGDVMMWRNNGGLARYGEARVRYGLAPGSSDLIGIVQLDVAALADGARPGRFLALEVKAGRRRETPEQRLFLALVRRRGGYAAVVRSVAEAMAAVDAARRGEP